MCLSSLKQFEQLLTILEHLKDFEYLQFYSNYYNTLIIAAIYFIHCLDMF